MTYVRNVLTGVPLLCCWEDCQKNGHEENKIVVRDGDKSLNYVFCTTRHRNYYRNSHLDNGNLMSGDKTIL